MVAAYQDRMSLRGIKRTFGVCYQTVMVWLGKKAESPAGRSWTRSYPARHGDVLELDELWSFVQASKAEQALVVGGTLPAHAPDRGLDARRQKPAEARVI